MRAMIALVGSAALVVAEYGVEIQQVTSTPLGGWNDTFYDMNGVVIADRKNQWRCGNTYVPTDTNDATRTAPAAVNSRAGIAILKGPDGKKSLDWLKDVDAQVANETDRTSYWFRRSFDSLFCADYLKGLRNPRASDFAGVCIRVNEQGHRWRSIVQADEEAREHWTYFGNINGSLVTPLAPQFGGYQKSTPEHRAHTDRSWNVRWGSGGKDDLPGNWCSEYMKQMMCHIAFPQYAGSAPSTGPLREAWLRGDTNGSSGALVRPVCGGWCASIMDLCNRAEPAYSSTEGTVADVAKDFMQPSYTGKGLLADFSVQNLALAATIGEPTVTVREAQEENGWWCDIWNRGFGLASAGTGVGYGTDEEVSGPEDSSRFCAEWNAGATAAPAVALTLGAIATALLVHSQ